ncbi:MAG: hypothetical protein J0H23_13080 [Micrococcales bacterium]|nr:hypothetical protein [Micrococcales bacterium]OJX69148.1 MAG: hypothetical protein BGO94_11350 [Micrococcales bacterium 72-143]
MNDITDDAEARLRRAASVPDAPELDAALVTGAPDRHAPRLVRHGRAVRAAGVSLTAVAAVSVGALVLPGVIAPRAPLFAAASGAGGRGEAGAMSADTKLAWWVNYHYVAGSGLSTEGGHGSVYQLKRVGDPDSVLTDAAAALGIDGTPTLSQYSTPDYPSYVVGPEDGSGPSISLSWAGTGDWWYNDPAAYPAAVCTDAPVEGGAPGETYQDCTQPEIPASESKAPSEAEARTLAAAIFDATGFDVAAADIRVTADSWQTLATANLVVDGTTTALEYSVAWSPLGKVSWAAGHSVEVVERGGFDTVSAVAAVDRIADGRWYGAAGPDYQGNMVMYAADSGVARSADGASTSSGTGAGSDPVSPAPSEPADPGDPGVVLPEPEPSEVPGAEPTDPAEPVDPGLEPEPVPTPETVTVTLDHAESTLLMLWDVDGNAWLVPGYAFENPDGGFWTTIVSLVEGVIALPEPMQIEPMPADATP